MIQKDIRLLGTDDTWSLLPDSEDVKDVLLCDKSDFPYPDKLDAVIDREMAIRAIWQESLRSEATSLAADGKYAQHKPCRYVAEEAIPKIIEGVMAELNKLSTKAATCDKQNIELLAALPWIRFSFIAFNVVVNAAINHSTIHKTIEQIAQSCEMEAKWQHYSEREAWFVDHILEQQHKNGSDTDHINTVLTIAMNRRAEGKYKDKNKEYTKDPALVWENWPKGEDTFSHWLGALYLSIICATTQLFTKESYLDNNKKTCIHIIPTDKFIADITKIQKTIGLYGGYYLPLPVPPRDWTTTNCGGFWTMYGGQKHLIKNWSKGYQEEMLNMSEQLSRVVFPAINAAQHTAWRINERVYDVLMQLSKEPHGIAGLPASENPELPVCPHCGKVLVDKDGNFLEPNHECFADPNQAEKDAMLTKLVKEGKKTKEARIAVESKFGGNSNENLKKWKAAASEVYRERTRLVSLRLSLRNTLDNVCNIIRSDDRFYFVYQTDFRGRLYPLGILNPQGTDWQKGLLEFADGVALGETGAKWLAIHLANCWANDGIDKKSYADRVQWVHDNERFILACAAHPLDCLDWTKADSPFCFLAACFEWEGYKKEGNAYKSHVAVALDGSCSGIQHYSAMLRDEVGAIATNVKCLDPTKGKHDIYGEVAAATTKLMTQDVADAKVGGMATFILAKKLINRDVVKRAVMTLPYGSKYLSCNHYVTVKLTPKLTECGITDKKVIKDFCDYAATTVWHAIPTVVHAARQGMDYLQKLARLFAHIKMPITWTTPTGFIVQQSYYSVIGKVVRLITGGSIVLKNDIPILNTETSTLSFQRPNTREIDPARQVSGIAPNFIHSLDASHLMFSVKAATEQGINNFALIHDSLGVHAGLTEKFSVILRECFYHLYNDNDPLQDLTTHLVNQLPEDLQENVPELPCKGNLDISNILSAIYLFA